MGLFNVPFISPRALKSLVASKELPAVTVVVFPLLQVLTRTALLAPSNVMSAFPEIFSAWILTNLSFPETLISALTIRRFSKVLRPGRVSVGLFSPKLINSIFG